MEFYVNFGADYIQGLSALNFWSNNFSISARPSFDQKTQRLAVSKKENSCFTYFVIFFKNIYVKISRFSGMLLLSDWLQDFWDICGGFGLGEGEATFVHLFDRQIKEMWYLCESISLRVWVMDKGNKFSLPPPHALIDIHWMSQISTLVKFVWNLWFSHFPISSSNRFGPIPPLEAHPWGILNFCDVSKIGRKYLTKS